MLMHGILGLYENLTSNIQALIFNDLLFMQRTFFIGDIHGCSKTFKKMVQEKISPNKRDVLCCVGDYIDRGPDSKGVIDYIMELRNEGFQVFTLRGNHEQMLLDSTKSVNDAWLWMMNGGRGTLDGFHVNAVDEIESRYMEFFKHTHLFWETNEFIAVHAGLNFEADNPLNDKESMLWIRNFPVDSDFLNGKLLVHGHTPVSKHFITTQNIKQAVNIDGGCVFKNHPDMGNLVAYNFTEKQLLFQPNIDKF